MGWGEAILSACHVLNHVPHKKFDKTSYELWKGHPPNLNYLKVWGCLDKMGLPKFKREKIGPEPLMHYLLDMHIKVLHTNLLLKVQITHICIVTLLKLEMLNSLKIYFL